MATVTSRPPTEPTGEASPPAQRNPRSETGDRRRPVRAIAAASAVAAIAVVVAILVWGGNDSADDTAVEPLRLSTGETDAVASCLPFDVGILSGMSPAFAATVTAGEGETVTLRVDRWYAGDPGTDVVELTAPAGMEALIGGFEMTVGDQYLITSTDGVVNYCGYSGPATTEMTDAFDQAFPA